LLTVQLHPNKEVTFIDPVLGPEFTTALVGEMVNVQGAFDWMRVKFWLAMVTIPVRIRPVGLLVIVKTTAPLFDPLIVLTPIQLLELFTTQEQPVRVVTATVILLEPKPIARLVGAIK
jgi:hypothetical protein